MNSKLDVTVAVDTDSGPNHCYSARGSGMTVSAHEVQKPPPSSIFGTLRRWPLMPSEELCRLQVALTQCVELAGPHSAHELLRLVTDELERRTAETPHLPARTSGSSGLRVRAHTVAGRGARKAPRPRPGNPENRTHSST